ncbi:MarR family winged helix-turn-helix transcriptional regulator [Leuconostoc litchii]|uniref:MarR family transcriptional regulator n=1 Tax=Leuconostoc litchii TaxID=1981069 RepID=A0A652NDQ5_9LACO|nr:MarR family transcriptional regulator [Leuconostoc litchii]TYC46016.1 MarR family transcriptional regulator [Leuconostoc litchii]
MENYELLNDFIDVYMSALKNLEKLISQPTSEYGASFEQWLIMAAIANSNQPLTMTEIARDRGVTKGAVARQLKPLFDCGYLKHLSDHKDHRRVLLMLTDEGLIIEKQMTSKVQHRFNKWLDIFGLEAGQDFLVTLKRFQELIVLPELHDKKKIDSD